MTLSLAYRDKYRLWNDLLRGNVDRLFVPAEEQLPITSSVSVQIRVAELLLPIVVKAQIVGRRGRSRRFPRGVYVRIPDSELEKCRRFLALRHPSEANDKARRALRVDCELPLTILSGEGGSGLVRNISETGMLVAGPVDVAAGQRLRVRLDLHDGVLESDASVAWADDGRHLAGLDLVDLEPETSVRLHGLVGELTRRRDAPAGPMPILVADDDRDILRLLSQALSKHGYEVFQATDGDQAVELIRRLRPRLVVLDLLLPGVDGAHICKVMRADAEMVDVPVILVSALDEPALHSVADEVGATDYLAKPLHLADLLDLIGVYLREYAAPA